MESLLSYYLDARYSESISKLNNMNIVIHIDKLIRLCVCVGEEGVGCIN